MKKNDGDLLIDMMLNDTYRIIEDSEKEEFCIKTTEELVSFCRQKSILLMDIFNIDNQFYRVSSLNGEFGLDFPINWSLFAKMYISQQQNMNFVELVDRVSDTDDLLLILSDFANYEFELLFFSISGHLGMIFLPYTNDSEFIKKFCYNSLLDTKLIKIENAA